jgi:hypothetical protein
MAHKKDSSFILASCRSKTVPAPWNAANGLIRYPSLDKGISPVITPKNKLNQISSAP